jgi:hypothetical protein
VYRHSNKRCALSKVDEYVELNNIKIPPKGTEWPPGDKTKKHMKAVYSFVSDPKFIDFAFKKSGIMFSEEMFEPYIKEL